MRAKDKTAIDAKRQPSETTIRNRRRYSAFLRMKDAYPDLTFQQFLTHAYFADTRRFP